MCLFVCFLESSAFLSFFVFFLLGLQRRQASPLLSERNSTDGGKESSVSFFQRVGLRRRRGRKYLLFSPASTFSKTKKNRRSVSSSRNCSVSFLLSFFYFFSKQSYGSGVHTLRHQPGVPRGLLEGAAFVSSGVCLLFLWHPPCSR